MKVVTLAGGIGTHLTEGDPLSGHDPCSASKPHCHRAHRSCDQRWHCTPSEAQQVRRMTVAQINEYNTGNASPLH